VHAVYSRALKLIHVQVDKYTSIFGQSIKEAIYEKMKGKAKDSIFTVKCKYRVRGRKLAKNITF
jgi:hypothetical protein